MIEKHGFEGLLGGCTQMYFRPVGSTEGFSSLPIVENSISIDDGDEDSDDADNNIRPIHDDNIRPIRHKVSTELSAGSFSFDCSLNGDNGEAMAKFLGMDCNDGNTGNVCSLVIQCKPVVNKPKNLRYPHKRRKMRILKKWAKRFGRSEGKYIVLPRVRFDVKGF